MGSNPCRKIQLLGIAHPVVGITISGTEDIPRWDASEALEAKKWPDWPYSIFCKLWVKDLVFIVICN